MRGFLKAAALARRGRIVFTRLREILYPVLVISIIGSLWFVGRTQELEEDIRSGNPPNARWAALIESSSKAAALSESSHASTAD